jgi:hypothetical protein
MSYTERLLAENFARETNWADTFRAGALGLMLCAPQMTGVFAQSATLQPIIRSHVQDTQRTSDFGTNREYLDILGQFARVYEYLFTENVDLDEEAHRLLYSNLWKLYE